MKYLLILSLLLLTACGSQPNRCNQEGGAQHKSR